MRDEIRQAIKGGTQKSSLEALQKRGVKNVHVIDEAKILRLIEEAVELAVRRRDEIGGERDAVTQDARLQFQKMLRQHQKALRVQDSLQQAKVYLDDHLHKILAQFGASGSQSEGLAGLRELGGHITRLLLKIEEKEKAFQEQRARGDDLETRLAMALAAKTQIEKAVEGGLQDEFGDFDWAALDTPEGRRLLSARLAELEQLRRQIQQQGAGHERAEALARENAALRDRVKKLAVWLGAGEGGDGNGNGATALPLVLEALITEREELVARLERQQRQSLEFAREVYALQTGRTSLAPAASGEVVIEV